MYRFNGIAFFPSDMRVVDCVADPVASKQYGDYVVDDSSFVPMSEAVKRVTGGTLSQAEIKQMYDFPDGKDTGRKIPVDRSHRFTGDIVEVYQDNLAQQAAFNDKMKAAKEQFDFEQKLNAINGVDSSSSPTNASQ